MTYRRCPNCREFYPKKDGDCPECGAAGAAVNSHLDSARLNNHLYGMAEAASKERQWERAYRGSR